MATLLFAPDTLLGGVHELGYRTVVRLFEPVIARSQVSY